MVLEKTGKREFPIALNSGLARCFFTARIAFDIPHSYPAQRTICRRHKAIGDPASTIAGPRSLFGSRHWK
jgi:hypothetical protein